MQTYLIEAFTFDAPESVHWSGEVQAENDADAVEAAGELVPDTADWFRTTEK
jgi:hypothetical protein